MSEDAAANLQSAVFWLRAHELLRGLRPAEALLVWSGDNAESSLLARHLTSGQACPGVLFACVPGTMTVFASPSTFTAPKPLRTNIGAQLTLQVDALSEWKPKLVQLLRAAGTTRITSVMHDPTRGFGKTVCDSLSHITVVQNAQHLELLVAPHDSCALQCMKQACASVTRAWTWFANNVRKLDREAMERMLVAELTNAVHDRTFVQTSSESVTIVSLAASVRGYHAIVVRTFLVDPTPAQKDAYLLLLNVRRVVRSTLVPYATIQSVYQAVDAWVKAQAAVPHRAFVEANPTLGYLIGLDFSSRITLDQTSEALIPPGSTFAVDLKLDSMRVCDVMLVQEASEPARVLTDHVTAKWEHIHVCNVLVVQDAIARRQQLQEMMRVCEALRKELGDEPKDVKQLMRKMRKAREQREFRASIRKDKLNALRREVDVLRSLAGGDAGASPPEPSRDQFHSKCATQSYKRALRNYLNSEKKRLSGRIPSSV